MKTTETKVLHTKGKISISDNTEAFGGGIDLKAKDYFIATVLDDISELEHEAQANAEHIVRCWNNFYPMLEALKECVGELECYDLSKESYPVLAKAIAIIKAAEQL